MDPKTAKKRLRSELGRRALPAPADVAAVADQVCARLLGEPAFTQAARIALYSPLPDEVSTRSLFAELIRLGRPCFFPRMLSDGRLAFARVDHLDDLRLGRYRIAEPPAAGDASLDEGDVVIVPGVAFDRTGARLGRGGGYYDRTFSVDGLRRPLLIGAIYADRFLESLPRDSHDRAMDAIVTEREFCWTRGGR